jgi:hypothetical protein
MRIAATRLIGFEQQHTVLSVFLATKRLGTKLESVQFDAIDAVR